MSEQFEIVDRDEALELHNSNSKLLTAIAATADTQRAVRVVLNGRTINALRSSFNTSLQRQGFRLRSRTDNKKGVAYFWVTKKLQSSSPPER